MRFPNDIYQVIAKKKTNQKTAVNKQAKFILVIAKKNIDSDISFKLTIISTTDILPQLNSIIPDFKVYCLAQ